MREIYYWQAVNEALAEEMQRDPAVFIMGEDVGVYGGAYAVTRGLLEKFGPERVRDTAISEAAIVGAGLGAAVTGMRPVVEIMYVDFMGIAMDQLNHQVAKIRYMFGGKINMPLVIRAPFGASGGVAAQHSQSLEAWFYHIPGLKVAVPITPYDMKGMLKTAIRDDNPVIFFEHKLSYPIKGEVPEGDYTIPFGKAAIRREGSDVTIVSYSLMSIKAQRAADELTKEGINCEVIDLRSLLPLDHEAIVKSVSKTHRLVVVQESHLRGGVASDIVAEVIDRAFDNLDAPPVRVGALNVPVPFNRKLENMVIPNEEKIKKAVYKALGR